MLFLIAGVRRSASTLAFQIASEITGEKFRIRHWEKRPKDCISNQDCWWTAKTHAYLPELLDDIENGSVCVFSTIRDPRDIAVSIMQLYGYPDGKKSSFEEVMARGWIQKDILAQEQWRRNAGFGYMAVKYELLYKDVAWFASVIAAFMGVQVAESRTLELADKFSYLNNRERSKEQVTISADMLSPGHVQTGMVGMWKYMLTDDQIVDIQDEIGYEWFEDNGYEVWKK
jgi:hypothetical protein